MKNASASPAAFICRMLFNVLHNREYALPSTIAVTREVKRNEVRRASGQTQIGYRLAGQARDSSSLEACTVSPRREGGLACQVCSQAMVYMVKMFSE